MSDAGEHKLNRLDKTGWPIDFEKLRKAPPLWLSAPLSMLGIIVGIALIILALIAIIRLGIDLIGGNPERVSDAIKSILPIAAAAIGLPLIIWRLVILSQQTRTAEDKTQIDREAHYTSIFSRSVDQLGQTKEIKETRERKDVLESISKTVPNIEVRLGGIHSLNRLAETSSRDVRKIINMLLSYVRENSWTDRHGSRVSRPHRERSDDFSWRYYYARGESPQNEKALNEWLSDSKLEIEHEEGWTGALPDSRVDVNEAIDALKEVAEHAEVDGKGTFYESLFVGRSFKREIMRSYDFERCIFVKCTFDAREVRGLEFSDCRFISCTLKSTDSALYFSRCTFVRLMASDSKNSTLHFHACDLLNSSFWRSTNLNFVSTYTSIYEGFIAGELKATAEITLKGSALAKTKIHTLKLLPNSTIESTGFADVTINDVDLSDAVIKNSNWTDVKAEPRSQHPSSLERPESWPPYDPNYVEDDDIPF